MGGGGGLWCVCVGVCVCVCVCAGADAGFWKGVRGRSNLLGLHAKGIGSRGGPALVPILKSLHPGPKGGGVQPHGLPPPPDSLRTPCVRDVVHEFLLEQTRTAKEITRRIVVSGLIACFLTFVGTL